MGGAAIGEIYTGGRMSDFHQLLVYVHATLGGLALLSGAVALGARKGGVKHKTGGRLFFYCMSVSTLLSLLMALMPGHGNPFLFAIGVFTLYLLWSGFRGLHFRSRTDGLWKDKLVSGIMVLTGAAMCIVPWCATEISMLYFWSLDWPPWFSGCVISVCSRGHSCWKRIG